MVIWPLDCLLAIWIRQKTSRVCCSAEWVAGATPTTPLSPSSVFPSLFLRSLISATVLLCPPAPLVACHFMPIRSLPDHLLLPPSARVLVVLLQLFLCGAAHCAVDERCALGGSARAEATAAEERRWRDRNSGANEAKVNKLLAYLQYLWTKARAVHGMTCISL